MKNFFMASGLALAALAHAGGTVTTDKFYEGASKVAKVASLQHEVEKQVSPGAEAESLYDTLHVSILNHNGSHTNPLGEATLLIEGREDGSSPSVLHKFEVGMSRIATIKNKWVKADNSSAGGYLFIKGTRVHPETGKIRAYEVEVKYTDSTNVYLDTLEVNAYYTNI
jgi:hypothetical protein